jgi:signal transduction histidine kinase
MSDTDPVHPSSAFRKRLTAALAVLAAVAALQGASALWAVDVTQGHVLRGRVAGDIQYGFISLSDDKQRLRNWVMQRQFGAAPEDGTGEALLAKMRDTLARLETLARQAEALDDSASARARQAQRRESLKVLDGSLDQMAIGLASVKTLPAVADAAAAWAAAEDMFDHAQGQDLRRLLADSLSREMDAVREKRANTDRSLARLRSLWIGTTAALVAAALLLAWYFARALRRPLLSLSQGAQALRQGDLSHRIVIDSENEFAAVARSMNAMARELLDHRQRETEARQALEEQVAARTAELSAALNTLQATEERRRQLLADISHELRTPTTAIRGEAQVTLRGADKPVEEYKGSLQRIADASKSLGVVIDDLLTMARSDMDVLSLRNDTVALTEVLDEVRSQGEAMARARAGEVTLGHAPWPGDMTVTGDAARLRQMFLALVDNAVRYSRPGGQVMIAARQIERQGPWVEVEISDNGIGIDEPDIGLVFERNRRSSRARAHSRAGSGLGLPIAQLLAQRHGGDITLRSGPGPGTTATVSLPLARRVRQVTG